MHLWLKKSSIYQLSINGMANICNALAEAKFHILAICIKAKTLSTSPENKVHIYSPQNIQHTSVNE